MDYPKFRLRSFTTLHPYYILKCGSYYELPEKYCDLNPTDEDAIYYYYDICAIPWNRNPPKNTKCTVLRIDSKKTPPGFARLVVDRDNMEDNPTYFRRPPVLGDIETGGPSLLLNDQSKNIGVLAWLHEHRLTQEDRACLTLNGNIKAFDMVLAVYCPYWPVEAEEWRKRKRFHGWPNEKLIARIIRGGCHFVSKLRTWSSCDDTEWRFSFSKAELLLIHSWTQDKKFAYHVIRLIKRRISEYCGGDENKAFQTYYFKTLMFWACEEFPREFWSEQSLNNCVQTLLLRFLKCLKEIFCPSYFIPKCNIMSHLKSEDSFEKELQMLQIFLRNVIGIVEKVSTYPSEMSVSLLPFEYACVNTMIHSFPLNKELNGRMAHYMSECEWFLPEMRNIHAAIEAHLRLMSVDSVTERQTSKDYVVCVENFDFASLNSEGYESFEYLNPEKSSSENFVRIFVRKLLRDSVVVYRRMSDKEESILKTIRESNVATMHGVTSAYRANFNFTAMQSYNECLTECEKCFEVLHNKAHNGFMDNRPSNLSSYMPVLVCNSLSKIFDEHLQVILGFVTLQRYISSSNPTASSHEVCLKMTAWEFMKYIYIQCKRKLYSISELTDCSFPANFNISDFIRPRMSQLMENAHYSAVILFAALRQSRAYKNTLRGRFIPDHISYSM